MHTHNLNVWEAEAGGHLAIHIYHLSSVQLFMSPVRLPPTLKVCCPHPVVCAQVDQSIGQRQTKAMLLMGCFMILGKYSAGDSEETQPSKHSDIGGRQRCPSAETVR